MAYRYDLRHLTKSLTIGYPIDPPEGFAKDDARLVEYHRNLRAQDKEDFVSRWERTLLRGERRMDPTILRLVGGCRWDVGRAWTEQQTKEQEAKRLAKEKKKEREAEATQREQQRAEGEREEEEQGMGVPTKSFEDQHDEEEAELLRKQKEEAENMFMLAPTTFYESADIFLVTMTFMSSRDFFSTIAISKRWHHVAKRMSEARGLIRSFCLGMHRSFTCNGVFPTAIASAGTPTSLLKAVLQQTKQELGDPNYNGRNGGALVPLYAMRVNETSNMKVALGGGENTFEAAGVTATLLDSTCPLELGWMCDGGNKNQSADQVICLCVGRLPTEATLVGTGGRLPETRVSRQIAFPHRLSGHYQGALGFAADEQQKEEEEEERRLQNLGYSIDKKENQPDYLHTPELPTTLRFSLDLIDEGSIVPLLYIRTLCGINEKGRMAMSRAVRSSWTNEVGHAVGYSDHAASLTAARWDRFSYSIPAPVMIWETFRHAYNYGTPVRTEKEVKDRLEKVRKVFENFSTPSNLLQIKGLTFEQRNVLKLLGRM